MKSIIGAISVLFLSTATIRAQEIERHIESPFNHVAISGCSENVALEGFIYSIVTYSDKGQRFSYRISSGPRGDVKAIGLDTGNRYNVVGHTISSWEATKNFTTFGFVNTFNVVGLFKVHQTMKLVFDERPEDGLPIKLSVVNNEVVCK